MNYESYFNFRRISPQAHDAYRLPPWLLSSLPKSKDARILDIGCGYGQTLRELRRNGYVNARGVDISHHAVKVCHEQGLDALVVDDLEQWQPEAPYHFIFMSHVLEHIAKPRIIPTCAAIRSFLFPGGKFCVAVPNAQSATNAYWAYEDFTHETLFTSGSLYFVLRSAGFDQIDFLDRNGLEGKSFLTRCIKYPLILAYRAKLSFWNRVTSSSFHQPSEKIFTFEIKALAQTGGSHNGG
jgi:SAM-dependent methyltransferase